MCQPVALTLSSVEMSNSELGRCMTKVNAHKWQCQILSVSADDVACDAALVVAVVDDSTAASLEEYHFDDACMLVLRSDLSAYPGMPTFRIPTTKSLLLSHTIECLACFKETRSWDQAIDAALRLK